MFLKFTLNLDGHPGEGTQARPRAYKQGRGHINKAGGTEARPRAHRQGYSGTQTRLLGHINKATRAHKQGYSGTSTRLLGHTNKAEGT